MVQIANPSADAFNGDGWHDVFNNSEIFSSIVVEDAAVDLDLPEEEVTIDDWIRSSHEPVTDVYVTQLAEIVDPQDLAGDWKIKIRMQKSADVSTRLDLTVQLLQFYIDEVNQGELIYEETIPDIAFGYQDYEITIPDTSALISPMDQLFVRVSANTI